MINVSTRGQLLDALGSAKGGETIVLANGEYGSLDIVGRAYSGYVTITSKNPLGAKFDYVDIVNSSYVRIDGVHVDNASNGSAGSTLVSVTNGSHHVEFLNNEVNGRVDNTYNGHFALYTNGSVSDVTFAGNYLHDVKRGGVFYSAKDLTVSGNTVDYIGDDNFKYINVNGVLIENNVAARYYYPEPGAHLDFIQFQGSDSQNITIRGNVSLPANRGDVQGIFLDDAHYTNVLIENNIIVTGMFRGVSVSSGTNVTARYNTVLDIEGAGSKATMVTVPGQSYGNIMATYDSDKRLGETNGNLYLQQTDTSNPWHYDNFFSRGDAGLGITIGDLRPVAGSLVEDYGAYDRLLKVLSSGLGSIGEASVEPKEESDSGSGTDTGSDSGSEGTGSGAGTDTGSTDTTDTTTDSGSTGSTDNVTDTSKPADTSKTGTINDAAFSMTGTKDIAGASDVIEIAPDASLNLAAGTIALTFQADTVSGKMGLVTRDASYYAGGGNHFAAYIEKGTLKVRFQDGSQDKVFGIPGIQAGKAYDLLVSFDGDTVNVTLDGAKVGSAEFSMTWLDNNEYMQFGALGWGSATGKAGFGNVFDGTLSDIVVIEGVKTPAEINALFTAATDTTDGTDTTGSTDGTGATDTTGDTGGNGTSDGTDGTGTTGETGDTGTTGPANTPDTPVENSDANVVFELDQAEFNGGKKSIVNLDHDTDLEMKEGTIAFTFNADDVSGRQGLVSKDAYGYAGGGNHISIFLEGDELIFRFQDKDSDATFSVENVNANKDYEVQTWFGDGKIGLALNGKLVATTEFDFDLSYNQQNLQIGGLGWDSNDGGDRVIYAFDGTISDMMILDEALSF